MGLKESAPLLSLIWPYALAVGGGVTLLGLTKVLLGATRGQQSATARRLRFTGGRPMDEDNYVFRDSEELESDDLDEIMHKEEQQGGGDEDDEEEGGEEEEEGENTQHVPYAIKRYSEREMLTRSHQFAELMSTRRTVRMFSAQPVPFNVIRDVVRTAGLAVLRREQRVYQQQFYAPNSVLTRDVQIRKYMEFIEEFAGTSPSGAHTEPWTYVLISDPEVKRQIRVIVEKEEELNYGRRMGQKWVADLSRMRTDWHKSYLEQAPHIVVVFKQVHGYHTSGGKKTHYYSEISTSISVGLFLAALTNVGLVTVTSSPMNAGTQLRLLLNRPANEKVLLLLPVGYPAKECTVPQLYRKRVEDIMVVV